MLANITRIAKITAGAIVVLVACACPTWAEDASARKLYEGSARAVVFVHASNDRNPEGIISSGVVICKTGSIVTLAESVYPAGYPADQIQIVFRPSRITGDAQQDLSNWVHASVAALDERLNLAALVLNKDLLHQAGCLELSYSDPVAGAPGIVIGHPPKTGMWTMDKTSIYGFVENIYEVPRALGMVLEPPLQGQFIGSPLIDNMGRAAGILLPGGESEADKARYAMSAQTVKAFLDAAKEDIDSAKNVGVIPARFPPGTFKPRRKRFHVPNSPGIGGGVRGGRPIEVRRTFIEEDFRTPLRPFEPIDVRRALVYEAQEPSGDIHDDALPEKQPETPEDGVRSRAKDAVDELER